MPRRDPEMARWIALGRRLRERDPARYLQVFKLCQVYVSAYDDSDDSDAVFTAQCASIVGSTEVN